MGTTHQKGAKNEMQTQEISRSRGQWRAPGTFPDAWHSCLTSRGELSGTFRLCRYDQTPALKSRLANTAIRRTLDGVGAGRQIKNKQMLVRGIAAGVLQVMPGLGQTSWARRAEVARLLSYTQPLVSLTGIRSRVPTALSYSTDNRGSG